MVRRENPGDRRSSGPLPFLLVLALCGGFFVFGTWQRSGTGKGDYIAAEITKQTDCIILKDLQYVTHHDVRDGNGGGGDDEEEDSSTVKTFAPCDDKFIDYTPCQDQIRAMKFPRENMNYRERHCPPQEDKLKCLIPAPTGYATPFKWPKSRDYVPFVNAPYKSLTVEKAIQNWIQYEGNVFRFPGGGTQFPHGADAYIDELASVIPLDNGMIRTALDTGCGVASWGAYLFKKNILTMSFAPRDSHEAQVQFALERGVPAVIGVLGTIKLPYPARAFDMAHCSRCLIQWGSNDGMYLMEVDRVLRPGGYWILSGPPINWKTHFKAWERTEEDLKEEQMKIENIAKRLCWEKIHEKGETAIWRKKINNVDCPIRDSQVAICEASGPDDVWYKPMEPCMTPAGQDEISSAEWKPFSKRLNTVPLRISSGSIHGITAETFQIDINTWKKRVETYKRVNKLIDSGRYRNIMDMNAGFGSFAASIESPKLWVMNVMPTIAENDTLGTIYERGLIGIYHDWCEAFSTYPRTYDLIHANGVFSLYKDKCDMEDILIEMDRILRPEGAVIIREHITILNKVKRIAKGIRWNIAIVDHEDGPLVPEKTLFAVKQYWTVEDKNITYSQ